MSDPGRGRREGLAPLLAASLPLALFTALPLLALALRPDPAHWLAQLGSEAARRALALTLITSTVSTLLCIALGLPVAYLLARYRFRGRAALDVLVDLPIAIPPVVAGLALLLAFGREGWFGRFLAPAGVRLPFTTAAVVLAQVTIAAPFFVRAARAGFESVDVRLEQAAWTLGAGRWRAFWTVAVPLARPSLIAGALLAWARALSEFGATMMFAGNLPGKTQTLALAVMSLMESDIDTALAVSALSLLLALVALTAARLVARSWRGTGP